ncbi:helix-turn-helix domain-containing protein [Brevibacillus marinus]|uniref:helix-turn-helix domain-containing protein n=1 Tax=Brevibacillus marinus TaxID=2496837 RepID=UPI000F8290FE|nr:helix-turn-helix domain-containing protein [Brevibacillus marinus]
MAKLLIADRDPNERTGIAWLVSSYTLNYETVLTAGTPADFVRLMEAERPEVICLELDMIPRDGWDNVRELILHYRPQVIVMTAEATFERALQGIQLHALDLWVKPQSPDTIRRVLTRLAKETAGAVREAEEDSDPLVPAVSYHSLFLPQESPAGCDRLLLIQPENTGRLSMLLHYLQDYPFRTPPVLLPLSDAIVCVFTSAEPPSAQKLHHTARRLLREWEETHVEPLSVIIYEAEDPLLPLHQQYRHAKQALEIRFFTGYRQISLVKGKVDWLMIDPFLTPAEQRTWIEMLNDGDWEKIKRWMYREFLNKTAPYPEPGLLRTRLTSILAQVRRFLKANCLDEGEIEVRYHQIFETILYNPILYRIVQEFLLFLYEVFETHRRRETARTDVIEQAVRYMEERFAQSSLRLEEVARHVDRSPAYLSHLISKRTGRSFRQLLTSLRLKEAQRLLRETNLSIQEVAGKCGFDNAHYFSRIFKEKTGTSPRQFRNRKK